MSVFTPVDHKSLACGFFLAGLGDERRESTAIENRNPSPSSSITRYTPFSSPCSLWCILLSTLATLAVLD